MGERPSSANDLVEIAPVLCFLFGQNAHRVTDMSPDELIEQSNQVLDRLLGTGGQRPTRAAKRQRFDDDPRHANTLSPPVNNADGRDDIELEAILNAIDEDSAVAPAQLESRVVEDAAGRPHMDLTRNGDSHAKVLAAIDDSPGLIPATVNAAD
ncbi:hypothetical protein PInf_010278 [Phytophthora infestans]|nr:hypothetical protein PInf_010278 [Phytophthora infestans]